MLRHHPVRQGRRMLFNTIEFWLFFAAIFGAYACLPRLGQNVLLLAGSYFFYACWDWRFLGLLVLSTTIDWMLANAIRAEATPAGARRWVAASVVVNLVFLGFFKYFNFFIASANGLLAGAGFDPVRFHLNVVLPVGISFYTFQSMSYIIDVYRREVEPAANPVDFALFVAFFPHMVAGPIMHANQLLPQMQQPRRMTWEKIASGFHLAMWGLFKKVVVADNLALIADAVFNGKGGFRSGHVHAGTIAFAFQILCDFSGYTDIARGTARMMGFELMENFRRPYFATSITEFWRRWHISLSSWLRDYLYIPLGGNRHGPRQTYRNLFLTMLLGGLWHGASWTFVVWGAYHGALLAVERFFGVRTPAPGACDTIRPVARVLRTLVCFHFVCLGWVAFRCDDASQLGRIALTFLDPAGYLGIPGRYILPLVASIAPVLIMDALAARAQDELPLRRWPWPARAAAYLAAIYTFILFGRFESNAFIYFQF